MGEIDLDPTSSVIAQATVKARKLWARGSTADREVAGFLLLKNADAAQPYQPRGPAFRAREVRRDVL